MGTTSETHVFGCNLKDAPRQIVAGVSFWGHGFWARKRPPSMLPKMLESGVPRIKETFDVGGL